MEHIWTNKVKLIVNQARIINLYKIIDVLGDNINTLFCCAAMMCRRITNA